MRNWSGVNALPKGHDFETTKNPKVFLIVREQAPDARPLVGARRVLTAIIKERGEAWVVG